MFFSSDPRLKRGISNIMENESLVSAARSSVLQDIQEDNHHQMFQTFVLPDLTIYPDDFREFLKKELIESSTLNSLQSAGMLPPFFFLLSLLFLFLFYFIFF
jgi:OTU domain-containing protein 7